MVKLNNPFSFVNMKCNKRSKICISKPGKFSSSAKQKKQINVDCATFWANWSPGVPHTRGRSVLLS